MNPLILENTIQNLTTSTCGSFQLYIYKNLFDPDEKSKILIHQTLTKSTLFPLMVLVKYISILKIIVGMGIIQAVLIIKKKFHFLSYYMIWLTSA